MKYDVFNAANENYLHFVQTSLKWKTKKTDSHQEVIEECERVTIFVICKRVWDGYQLDIHIICNYFFRVFLYA